MHRALTWVIFLGAAAGVLYVGLSILRPFANVIAWSAVLAIICYPLQQRLVRRTGRVALSAFITSALTVLTLVIPMLVIGAVAISEGLAAGHSLRGAFDAGNQGLRHTAAALAGRVGLDPAATTEWFERRASDWLQNAGHYSLSVGTSLVEAIASSLFVVFALFLMLRDGENLVRTIPDLLPFERRRSERLLRRIADVVQASVYGVVVIAAMQGVLCGAMLWLLGFPSAVLWGVVTVFASVLPVVGAFAVWGPATVYLAGIGQWPHAMVLAVWGTLVVSGIDNVLRPRLVAGRVGLSELAMFFALLGGFTVFGAIGVVLGPAVFATAAAIVDTLRLPETEESAASSGQPRCRAS
jgi:predicted PurR-regulated permease PerM